MQYLLHVLLVTFVTAIMALPNGAPVCNIGAANVQAQHLQQERNPKTGSNEFGKYQTVLAGTAIITVQSDPTFVNLFQFGVENTLVIQSGAAGFLKGILVIASGGITDDINSLDTRTPAALTISDTDRTKEATGCLNLAVSGITHTTGAEKRNIAMRFKWPTEGQKLYLDVNIVKTNNSTSGSEYYFTQYPLQSASISDPSTSCGLFGLSIFCPLKGCGLFGRLLGLCND
jgi:hypothetical protein